MLRDTNKTKAFARESKIRVEAVPSHRFFCLLRTPQHRHTLATECESLNLFPKARVVNDNKSMTKHFGSFRDFDFVQVLKS